MKQVIDELFGIISAAKSQQRIGMQLVRAMESVPVPSNQAEADILAYMHGEFMGSAIGAAILYHIDGHGGDGGKACAEAILERCIEQVRSTALGYVKDGCVTLDVEDPFKVSDHNATVKAEILADIEADKK